MKYAIVIPGRESNDRVARGGIAMGKVVLDDALRAKLNGLNESLEVFDEAGGRVGCFFPESEIRAMIGAWAATRWTPAEEERLAAQTGGRFLADIWKDLGRS